MGANGCCESDNDFIDDDVSVDDKEEPRDEWDDMMDRAMERPPAHHRLQSAVLKIIERERRAHPPPTEIIDLTKEEPDELKKAVTISDIPPEIIDLTGDSDDEEEDEPPFKSRRYATPHPRSIKLDSDED